MKLSNKLAEGMDSINKILWIILIPIVLDISQLFLYKHMYKESYIPIKKIFLIKIGIISSPPSLNFLLEDFPQVLFKYNLDGFTGIINEVTLFNVFFIITFMLVIGFVNSLYLSIISKADKEKCNIKECFSLGNKLWIKFFILKLIESIPILFMLIKREFIFLGFINMIFIYVQYSFVVDECSVRKNFREGISFLFANLGLTIKMAFYFGFIFSALSLVVYVLSSLGTIGIVLDIIIVAYLGAAVNKAVLDIYIQVKYSTQEHTTC